LLITEFLDDGDDIFGNGLTTATTLLLPEVDMVNPGLALGTGLGGT
jgi:hypothetical protein